MKTLGTIHTTTAECKDSTQTSISAILRPILVCMRRVHLTQPGPNMTRAQNDATTPNYRRAQVDLLVGQATDVCVCVCVCVFVRKLQPIGFSTAILVALA